MEDGLPCCFTEKQARISVRTAGPNHCEKGAVLPFPPFSRGPFPSQDTLEFEGGEPSAVHFTCERTEEGNGKGSFSRDATPDLNLTHAQSVLGPPQSEQAARCPGVCPSRGVSIIVLSTLPLLYKNDFTAGLARQQHGSFVSFTSPRTT